MFDKRRILKKGQRAQARVLSCEPRSKISEEEFAAAKARILGEG